MPSAGQVFTTVLAAAAVGSAQPANPNSNSINPFTGGNDPATNSSALPDFQEKKGGKGGRFRPSGGGGGSGASQTGPQMAAVIGAAGAGYVLKEML